MTAASGDPGDKPAGEGPQQPAPGGYEAPPIEQTPTYPPAGYGGISGPGYPPRYPGQPPAYNPPPEYWAAYPGGYGAPMVPQSGINPLTIFSLVASLAGLISCGLSSPIGILLGAISLRQIKNTGQQGRALAVAAIVIGGVTLVFALLIGSMLLTQGF